MFKDQAIQTVLDCLTLEYGIEISVITIYTAYDLRRVKMSRKY